MQMPPWLAYFLPIPGAPIPSAYCLQSQESTEETFSLSTFISDRHNLPAPSYDTVIIRLEQEEQWKTVVGYLQNRMTKLLRNLAEATEK